MLDGESLVDVGLCGLMNMSARVNADQCVMLTDVSKARWVQMA